MFPQNYYQQNQTSLINVRNEMEARNCPIAPGNSVTFMDETSPFIYTKTMGFSPLERPVFKKYRLIEDETSQQAEIAPERKEGEYVTKNDFDALVADVTALQADINALKTKKPIAKKKEAESDE